MARYPIEKGDMLFVISNSGVNVVPVEIARLAKNEEVIVVAVCAYTYASAERSNFETERLVDIADHILDNGSQKGDACWICRKIPVRFAQAPP